MAEASFTEEKHVANCNAEKLRQTEVLARLKARSQMFDYLENDRYLTDRYVKRSNSTLMGDRTRASTLLKV